MSIDIHQEVTNKIVAAIEAADGRLPWNKLWNGKGDHFGLPLRFNGEPYQGINVVLLWMEEKSAPMWMTYKQAQELGAQVKKGEKGTRIYFTSQIPTKDDPEKKVFFLKSYVVFNETQIENLPEKYRTQPPRPVPPDQFFDKLGADVRHGGNRAFFSPSKDFIQLPHPDDFVSKEAYHAVKAHEFVHWTGHESRLDRKLKSSFGTEDYAKEELIAELGSAFLCAQLGLTNEVREDHAAYIQSWLGKLKDDKRYIFSAASAASKAVTYLVGHGSSVSQEEAGELVAA